MSLYTRSGNCLLPLSIFCPLRVTVNSGIDASEIEIFTSDAIETLITLGVSKNEAYRLVKQTASKNMTLEEIITNVLRGMSK